MGRMGRMGEQPPRDPTRAQVWLAVVVALAGCDNCMNPAAAILWADEISEKYAATFITEP